ncbi:hypothetical protein [Trinickia dinghuensis]|nr:hypothetical protein [Trinickia dinghuensis]
MPVKTSDQEERRAASSSANATDYLRGVRRITVSEVVRNAIARIATVVQNVFLLFLAIMDYENRWSLALLVGGQEADVDAGRVRELVRKLVNDVVRSLQIRKRIGIGRDIGAPRY